MAVPVDSRCFRFPIGTCTDNTTGVDENHNNNKIESIYPPGAAYMTYYVAPQCSSLFPASSLQLQCHNNARTHGKGLPGAPFGEDSACAAARNAGAARYLHPSRITHTSTCMSKNMCVYAELHEHNCKMWHAAQSYRQYTWQSHTRRSILFATCACMYVCACISELCVRTYMCVHTRHTIVATHARTHARTAFTT